MKKFLGLIISVVLLVMVLAGCGAKVNIDDYKDDTLAIKKDGTLYDLAVVDFDESTDAASVKEYVTREVNEFNATHAAFDEDGEQVDPVTIVEFTNEGKHFSLKMKYADADTYRQMNNITFEWTDASRASAAARTINIIDSESGEVVSWASVDSEYKVVLVDTLGTERVAVEGKIVYVSENVNVESKNEVTIDSLSVIIYK